METFIGTIVYLIIVIMCYYINKHMNLKEYKNGETWEWSDVRINIIFSLIIPLSIGYWIYVMCSKLPSFPEEPPKWL